MMQRDFESNEQTMSACLPAKNVCLKRKEVLLMLYYIDKNRYLFMKECLTRLLTHFGRPKPSGEC